MCETMAFTAVIMGLGLLLYFWGLGSGFRILLPVFGVSSNTDRGRPNGRENGN